jgi:CII-binding regulator of phage lambda lysogenization HflD
MLRQLLILCFVLTAVLQGVAQANDYFEVDFYALNAPKEATQTLSSLSHYLKGTGKFGDREKARSIYSWITHNIRYNHATIELNQLGTRENTLMQRAENVLEKRSAVCEGYANLYLSLANLMGLKAEIVTGKVRKEDGQIAEIGHAWVAIQLNREWYLSDPTWGAGSYDQDDGAPTSSQDDQYFLVDPGTMIRDHYPYDPVWQLNRFPMTQAQWQSWDLVSPAPQNASTLPFFFADTIAYMRLLDTLQLTLNINARILRFNPDDDFALTQLGLKMYEQGLVAMVAIYENLFALESSPGVQLDTLRYFRQLQTVELDFARTWTYLNAVKNERLKIIQQQVQPLAYMQAELIFVRGHVHYTQLSRYCRENLSALSQLNQQLMLNRIRRETELATQYYQQSLNIYAQGNSAELLEKKSEIIFFLARCHYLNAISYLNASANRSNLEVEALANNLTEIQLGKAALGLMNKTIEGASTLATQAQGIAEMREDFPFLMAKFLANESLTRYDLASARYRKVFDNPLPYLGTNFNAALAIYRESENNAVEGLKLISSSSPTSDRLTIVQFLNAGGGLANIQIGAFQAQVAYKLHEKVIKNPSLESQDKTEALSRIRQAAEAFGKAKPYLELSGLNSRQLLLDLQSRVARLEELKKWWQTR